MNKLKVMAIGLIILFGSAIWANDGKTTKVMEEMVKFHDALVKETSGKLDTKAIKALLVKGADDKKDTEIFKKAIPLVEKLGKVESLQDKLNTYAQLVEVLSPVVGHHDNSKASLFYCSMEKKKWIAKGNKIVNPYSKDMRECGEKL